MDIIGILKAIVVGLFKAYFWLPNLVMDFCFAHLGSIGVLLGIFAFMLILFVQAYLLGMVWVLLGGKASAPAGRFETGNNLSEDDYNYYYNPVSPELYVGNVYYNPSNNED